MASAKTEKISYQKHGKKTVTVNCTVDHFTNDGGKFFKFLDSDSDRDRLIISIGDLGSLGTVSSGIYFSPEEQTALVNGVVVQCMTFISGNRVLPNVGPVVLEGYTGAVYLSSIFVPAQLNVTLISIG